MGVRTSLVNTARGLAKSMGERLPQCDADQRGVLQAVSLPPKLRQLLEPLLKEVESITEKIQESDREIEQIARKDYPETALLQQVAGVGPRIALTFVLTVEDKDRFQKSRDIGCDVGLRPRRSDSGQSQPQLRITKEGDRTCGRCWCKERTTSSAAGDQIPIYSDGACTWRNRAASVARRERW